METINPETENVNSSFFSDPSNLKVFQLWDGERRSTIDVKAKRQGHQFMALCPKHGDKNPSLSIQEEKGFFKCHGCGWKGTLYDPSNHHAKSKNGKPEAKYDYKNEHGNLKYQVVRFPNKQFRQRHKNKDGRWVWNLNGVQKLPYMLQELLTGPELTIIVEGEKDADNLYRLAVMNGKNEIDLFDDTPIPFCVTTNPGGAGKWQPDFSQYFEGKRIIIIPDADLAGFQHSLEVYDHLTKNPLYPHPKEVKILGPQALGEVKDISEWIGKGGTLEKFMEIVEDEKNFIDQSETIETIDKMYSEQMEIDKKIRIEKAINSSPSKLKHLSGMEFINGKLGYGAIWGKEKLIVSGKGLDFCDGESKFTKSLLTPEVWKRFEKGEIIDGEKLIFQLAHLFSSHIFFKDQRVPTFLATWTIGTYLFKIFNFYGYLWVNSPIKRCGKSILLDILSHVAFNSTNRLINPSEASVFRETDNNSSTLIIDEVEGLDYGDKEKMQSFMSLLNGGFQRGSQVSRVEKRNGEFGNIYFQAYSPKVLAGISRLVDTIEDRCFRVCMSRRLKQEKIFRFNVRKKQDQLCQLRENLYLWGLRNGSEVSTVYESLGEIKQLEGLDDRAKDIWESILAIASVVDVGCEDGSLKTFNLLTSLAKDMGKVRTIRESADEAIPMLISVIKSVLSSEAREIFISSDDLFEKVKNDGGDSLSFITSTKGLASYLSRFELFTRRGRIVNGKQLRGYRVTMDWIDDVEARYA